jgi:transmembrane sensor
MKDDIKKLLQRYIEGNCTPEEKETVETWYLNEASSNDDELQVSDYEEVQNQIWNRITSQRFTKTKKVSWVPGVAAAIIVLVLGVASYTYIKNNRKQEAVAAIVPGGNKAILTLANGEKIILSNLSNGEIAKQSGVKITKTKDGQLVYTVNEQGTTLLDKEAFNKIETPFGGKYQINLPDGTEVWLNAGSSLEYPISFKGKERVVKLTGEAYFDVAHDKAKPFKVISANQTIEVLGTQFNVNSYTDEPDTRTTLLEGSVRVSNGNLMKVLKPGQRSVLTSQAIAIQVSAIDEDISWKNGDFTFEGSSLATIMRQISRWYDVEVVYMGKTADVKFGGSISMSKSIEEVLTVLEMTEGVNFKLEGRRVLVMP